MAGLYEQRSPTMYLWLCLTSAWLLFYVLRSIILKVSSTAIIERDKRRSVRFQKGVRYLTRFQLIDNFEDRKGRIRFRYIFLPGSLNNGSKATEKALKSMKETQYYPFSYTKEFSMARKLKSVPYTCLVLILDIM